MRRFYCEVCGVTSRLVPDDLEAERVPCPCGRGEAVRVGVPPRQPGRTWPLDSDAMGVHPSQIPEAMQTDAKLGVSAEYLHDGRVRFTSPQHRKRFCEAHGFFDRNGGYGDPQRR